MLIAAQSLELKNWAGQGKGGGGPGWGRGRDGGVGMGAGPGWEKGAGGRDGGGARMEREGGGAEVGTHTAKAPPAVRPGNSQPGSTLRLAGAKAARGARQHLPSGAGAHLPPGSSPSTPRTRAGSRLRSLPWTSRAAPPTQCWQRPPSSSTALAMPKCKVCRAESQVTLRSPSAGPSHPAHGDPTLPVTLAENPGVLLGSSPLHQRVCQTSLPGGLGPTTAPLPVPGSSRSTSFLTWVPEAAPRRPVCFMPEPLRPLHILGRRTHTCVLQSLPQLPCRPGVITKRQAPSTHPLPTIPASVTSFQQHWSPPGPGHTHHFLASGPLHWLLPLSGPLAPHTHPHSGLPQVWVKYSPYH